MYEKVLIQKIENEVFDSFTSLQENNQIFSNKESDLRLVRKNKQVESTHEKSEALKCDICDFTTICEAPLQSKNNLCQHITTTHKIKETENNYSIRCSFCEEMLVSKEVLKFHLRSVHEFEEFECEICNKSYKNQNLLNYHIISVHEAKKSFKCEVCKNDFDQKSYLEQHISLVHVQGPTNKIAAKKNSRKQSTSRVFSNSNKNHSTKLRAENLKSMKFHPKIHFIVQFFF